MRLAEEVTVVVFVLAIASSLFGRARERTLLDTPFIGILREFCQICQICHLQPDWKLHLGKSLRPERPLISNSSNPLNDSHPKFNSEPNSRIEHWLKVEVADIVSVLLS